MHLDSRKPCGSPSRPCSTEHAEVAALGLGTREISLWSSASATGAAPEQVVVRTAPSTATTRAGSSHDTSQVVRRELAEHVVGHHEVERPLL